MKTLYVSLTAILLNILHTNQAITFGTVPECIKYGEDTSSYAFSMQYMDVDFGYSLTYTGYLMGYYVTLQATGGATVSCYFVVDKTSSVTFTNPYADGVDGTVKTQVYSVSGANCDTVSQTSTTIVSGQNYYPLGGKNKDNCAYLFFFSATENTGGQNYHVTQFYNVYYDYTAQPYGTSSNAVALVKSIYVIMLITLIIVMA